MVDLSRIRLPAWQWPFIAHLAIERQAEMIAAFLDHNHERWREAVRCWELSLQAMQSQIDLEAESRGIREHIRQEQLTLLEDKLST